MHKKKLNSVACHIILYFICLLFILYMISFINYKFSIINMSKLCNEIYGIYTYCPPYDSIAILILLLFSIMCILASLFFLISIASILHSLIYYLPYYYLVNKLNIDFEYVLNFLTVSSIISTIIIIIVFFCFNTFTVGAIYWSTITLQIIAYSPFISLLITYCLYFIVYCFSSYNDTGYVHEV
jgi:hypothetical protein